jgi:hypothetical protein
LGSWDGGCRTTMLPYSPSSFCRPVWTRYMIHCRPVVSLLTRKVARIVTI